MGSLRDWHKQEAFPGPDFQDDPALALIQGIPDLFGLRLFQSKWNHETGARFISFRIDFPTQSQKLDVLMSMTGAFPWHIRFYERVYKDDEIGASGKTKTLGKPKKEFTATTLKEFSDQLQGICPNWNEVLRK
jgi:hypothetical protein